MDKVKVTAEEVKKVVNPMLLVKATLLKAIQTLAHAKNKDAKKLINSINKYIDKHM